MAKKKEDLTLEEKLEKALVPECEQPFTVPENWVWTRLGDVYTWGSGGTPSRKNPEFYTGNIPWIKTGELCSGYIYDSEEKISEEAISKSSAKLFPINTIAIAMYGATIGKVAILGVRATTNQACACAKPNDFTNVKYLFYYAISQKDNFIKKGKGGAQPNISQEIIKTHLFPLPPLAEQQRIVDRIESLFSKLDEAKEKAQSALDSFENRKAAILHKAFTGALTKKWREENLDIYNSQEYLENIKKQEINQSSKVKFDYWKNPLLPGGWYETKVEGFLYYAGRIGWKGLKAEEYTEKGPMLLSVYNLNDGDNVTFNRVYHISDDRYQESPEIMVQEKDILLTKDGAGIGKLGYVDVLPSKATINSSLLLIRTEDNAVAKYVYYLLSGPKLQRVVKERITGSATPHLFQRDIKEFIIPVPSLSEQAEIVRILDSIFEKEKQAKELVDVIEKIDLMKKAILGRAFRGELGTNNPKEESALELLKEILQKEDN